MAELKTNSRCHGNLIFNINNEIEFQCVRMKALRRLEVRMDLEIQFSFLLQSRSPTKTTYRKPYKRRLVLYREVSS